MEEIDLHDMHMQELLWPTVQDDDCPPEGWDEIEGGDEDEDDGDALASAGMGTDEDYGYFGGEDSYLDGSYEE